MGWVCAEVSQAGVSATGDQCAEVGNALGPTLKRKTRKSHGTGGAPNGQDSALSMTVCDPALVAMLPTLGAQFGDTEEFRYMAKLFKGGGDDESTLSPFKSLMSGEAKQGPWPHRVVRQGDRPKSATIPSTDVSSGRFCIRQARSPVVFAAAKLTPFRFFSWETPGIGLGNPEATKTGWWPSTHITLSWSLQQPQSSTTPTEPSRLPGSQT